MIHALYTLKEKYRNKKIYLWDIERESICLLIKVAFRGINISGFVTFQKEYVGDIYMNRPVVILEQIEQVEDSVILLHDCVPKETIRRLPADQLVYWSDAQEIDRELHQRKVIIYGIDSSASQLCEKLAEEGIKTEVYCVTKKDYVMQKHRGKEVIEVVELDRYTDYAIIISGGTLQDRMEALKALSSFWRGQIYANLEDFIDSVDQINLIQSIDLAIKKSRKTYLYGKKNHITELIEETLNIYGVKINGYVYDIREEEQGTQNIYELAYDGIEDKLIIITEELPESILRARSNIELAGFSLEEENYTGIQGYTYSAERMLSVWETRTDPMVGWSIIYSLNRPGWRIYGKEETDRIRILVLGGSTSSEEYHPENWVSKLYYHLKKWNIKTTIYNGAHPGDDIVDEILRLLRDGYILKPHIVISMSGLNNCHRKDSISQFNEERLIEWVKVLSPDKECSSGLPCDESLYSFWSRNIKLLNLISQYYGADFFGFLQPMNAVMSRMTLRERSLYGDAFYDDVYKDFRQYANDNDGYINLLQLLEHQDGVCFDICHYTNKAHEIIADKVYETIMPTIQRLLEG
ncbi:MAG: SGNH/GDSL hydrolase family protein [Lachnospiraceae bacterium]|nr:SGNH/GDSL hydrolase family protein [Lachnospiraceae bacterium]